MSKIVKKTTNYILAGLFVLTACQSPDSDSEKSRQDETTTYKPLPASTEFDVVILNGRVMDPETNFDGVRNVGIKDGIIALITEEDIKGKKNIDATGLVVAPGFIDTHFHAVDRIATKMVWLMV